MICFIDFKIQINDNLDALIDNLYLKYKNDTQIVLSQVKTINEISNVSTGKRPSDVGKQTDKNVYPVVGASGVTGYTCTCLYNMPVIITGRVGTIGKVNYFVENTHPSDNALVLQGEYLGIVYATLRNYNFTKITNGSSNPKITQSDLKNIQIPFSDINTFNLINNIFLSCVDYIHKSKNEILLLCNLQRIILQTLSNQ